jgi:hypothetical protein
MRPHEVQIDFPAQRKFKGNSFFDFMDRSNILEKIYAYIKVISKPPQKKRGKKRR